MIWHGASFFRIIFLIGSPKLLLKRILPLQPHHVPLESCGPSNKEGGEPEFLVLEKILHIHLPKTLTLNHLRFHHPGKFAPNRFTSQSEQVRQLRSMILRCSAASVDMSFSPTDEILRLIISLLPFESAVQTSLLSSRWRALWNSALVRYGAIEGVADEVASFCNQFSELPIKHPRRLQYHFGRDDVLLASIAADDKLHLDFSTGKSEFPWQFDWELKFNNQNLSPSAFFVKYLCLKSVSYLTNDAVSLLVSNIPFLESLRITQCNGFRSLCIGSSPKLQRLTVLDCPDLRLVHIRCSKLRSFRVSRTASTDAS